MMIDIAAHLYGFTVVPLYDTLGHDTISYCLKHSNVENMFAASD
jgi:long-subunit acyl-CoA synthetase (AMP-forming)